MECIEALKDDKVRAPDSTSEIFDVERKVIRVPVEGKAPPLLALDGSHVVPDNFFELS